MRAWSARKLALALSSLTLVLLPTGAGTVEDPSAHARLLQQRLAGLVQQTRTASWTQTLWERKGDEEQLVRSRCLWRSDGAMRIDIEDGKGAGATLVRRGDRVVIRPPGILRGLKLNRSVSDALVRSLRGRDLRRAGFFADLDHVLDHWAEVSVAFADGTAVLRYRNPEQLPSRMAIRLATLAPESIEARENGVLVERVTFDDVRFDVPLEPGKLEP